MAMALQLELEDMVYELIRYLTTNPLKSDDKGFGSMMQSLFKSIMIPKAQEMYEHARVVRDADPSWFFYIEAYPFIVDGEFPDRVMLDLGGEWDHADAIQLEAEAQFYIGFLNVICAYDLPLDYAWITEFPELTGTIGEKFNTILLEIIFILNDSNLPTFLTLIPEEGEKRLADAGMAMGKFFLLMNEASKFMLTETDMQDDDLSGYHDLNENGKWDEGEPYKLPWAGYLSHDQNFTWVRLMEAAVSAGNSTLNGSPIDRTPDRNDWFLLSEMNFFIDALGLNPFLPPIPMNLGAFYYDQGPREIKDGLRNILLVLYQLTGA
jgi:hypothetical protein